MKIGKIDIQFSKESPYVSITFISDRAAELPANRAARHEAKINLCVDTEDRLEFAQMRDFSERGFMAQLYSFYPQGTRLFFILEGPESSFKCQGQIMWVRKHTIFPRRTYLAGVRIVGNKLTENFMDEIRGFGIKKKKKKQASNGNGNGAVRPGPAAL